MALNQNGKMESDRDTGRKKSSTWKSGYSLMQADKNNHKPSIVNICLKPLSFLSAKPAVYRESYYLTYLPELPSTVKGLVQRSCDLGGSEFFYLIKL